jgi:GTPase involved in cell partitioning and DNA repair
MQNSFTLCILADHNVKSLARVNSLYVGNQGERGRSKNCDGRNAEHIVVPVCENVLSCTS